MLFNTNPKIDTSEDALRKKMVKKFKSVLIKTTGWATIIYRSNLKNWSNNKYTVTSSFFVLVNIEGLGNVLFKVFYSPFNDNAMIK